MEVRALVDVYLGLGLGFKPAGSRFDYDGPPNRNLEPVDDVVPAEPAAEDPDPTPTPRRKKGRRRKTA